MIIDLIAAARTPDQERVRDWLSGQRVFVSSAMGDTMDERGRVAAAIETEGARPVWFEELGRDADAQEAYIAGLDTSTVYLGVLNELYNIFEWFGDQYRENVIHNDEAPVLGWLVGSDPRKDRASVRERARQIEHRYSTLPDSPWPDVDIPWP